jgi:hypothetical protein
MVAHIKVPHAWRSTSLIVLTDYNGRDSRREASRFLFSYLFGPDVLVYADYLEEAFEEWAAYLAEHAPGYIIGPEEERELYEAALDEMRDEAGGPLDLEDDRVIEKAQELATRDMTYTESGYIVSHEWGCKENLTREEMLDLLGREDVLIKGARKALDRRTA